MRFGGIKSKGHDSYRIMADPKLYCKPLSKPYRKRVEHIITLWTALWLIVSCPYLGAADCRMFNDGPQPQQFPPRERAE
eukprot:COSAG01_NODE_49229_length_374_cov_0.567273_1_plen_78_part_10